MSSQNKLVIQCEGLSVFQHAEEPHIFMNLPKAIYDHLLFDTLQKGNLNDNENGQVKKLLAKLLACD